MLALDELAGGDAHLLRAVLVREGTSAATSIGTSCSSTGTRIATSSGSSENQPTSETTSGLPSVSARIAEPDVSPIVGERRETSASQAAISDQSGSSVT